MPDSAVGTLQYQGRSVCSAGHDRLCCAVLSL